MTTPYIIKELDDAIAELEQLQAVQTLEYHNKNWLTNPKAVSEQQRASLKYIRHKIEHVAAVLDGRGVQPCASNPSPASYFPQSNQHHEHHTS